MLLCFVKEKKKIKRKSFFMLCGVITERLPNVISSWVISQIVMSRTNI
jgi:hypothetical protein